MRIFFYFLFVALSLSSCSYDVDDGIRTAKVNDGWQPDEVLINKTNMRLPAYARTTSIYREGTTESGYVYRIFEDGSASIRMPDEPYTNPLYEITFQKDKMDDKEKSYIKSEHLIYYYGAKKIASICVYQHDFPHRKAKIRLDNKQPITTDYNGCISSKYFNDFKKGDNVLVRYYVFPYDYYRDGEESLSGLKEADELLNFIRKNIDNMSFRRIF